VSGEKNYILYYAMLRQDKNHFYRYDEPNESNKDEPLSYVLHESPASVSTVRRGHPSLFSLCITSMPYMLISLFKILRNVAGGFNLRFMA
jgi:hypothetical protein